MVNISHLLFVDDTLVFCGAAWSLEKNVQSSISPGSYVQEREAWWRVVDAKLEGHGVGGALISILGRMG